jgi:hypothetical protein
MKHAVLVLACFVAAGDSLADEATAKARAPSTREKPAVKNKGASTPSKPTTEPTFVPGGMPQSFVIPANTCEQGTPLQKLLRDKPK